MTAAQEMMGNMTYYMPSIDSYIRPMLTKPISENNQEALEFVRSVWIEKYGVPAYQVDALIQEIREDLREEQERQKG